MSKIAYDPVKDRFASKIRHARFLRSIFYRLLDFFSSADGMFAGNSGSYGAGNSGLNTKWRILDAGCGFGQYDSFILRSFSNVSVKSVDVKGRLPERLPDLF